MKGNIGTTDRLLRIALAVLCAGIVFLLAFEGAKELIVLVLSGFLLYTGVRGYCPMYASFGLDTRRQSSAAHQE